MAESYWMLGECIGCVCLYVYNNIIVITIVVGRCMFAGVERMEDGSHGLILVCCRRGRAKH